MRLIMVLVLADWFNPLKAVELNDISALPIQRKVSAVRDLQLDIAIDLSDGPPAIS